MPFDIQRAYYLYDVPAGSHRGGHAHRGLYQLLIAMSGSFDITLDDGFEKKKFHLARPHYGLLITPMVWREMDNFSGAPYAWCWPPPITTRPTTIATMTSFALRPAPLRRDHGQ
ncbi:WxcM-like domain-containing protein [Halopseudomonas pachastrellae]|nr:WxcM-like domain-containing protein [Halopseudomonas pachastrellae]